MWAWAQAHPYLFLVALFLSLVTFETFTANGWRILAHWVKGKDKNGPR